MKTAVLYYTMSGTTRRYARAEADARRADLFEVLPARPYHRLSAFLRGCPAALHQKVVALADPLPDLADYDHIVLMSPVWAGFPAPVFNSMVEGLPQGAEVEVILTSASGHSEQSTDRVRAMLLKRGCTVTAQRDIRTAR